MTRQGLVSLISYVTFSPQTSLLDVIKSKDHAIHAWDTIGISFGLLGTSLTIIKSNKVSLILRI